MAGRKTDFTEPITLTRLRDARVRIDIEGVTPVIPHKWSEKAKRMMPGWAPMDGTAADETTTKGPKAKKQPRNPTEEAEACVYRLPDGRPGLPATAFKAAMVSACRFFDKPSMTEAKLLLFVEGVGPDQLVPIEGTPILREDTPRNANGGADLRYRYAFYPWKATVAVRFLPTSTTEQTVVALLDAGGRCGVGDWRPSAPKSTTGTFGQFRVVGEDSATDATDTVE